MIPLVIPLAPEIIFKTCICLQNMTYNSIQVQSRWYYRHEILSYSKIIVKIMRKFCKTFIKKFNSERIYRKIICKASPHQCNWNRNFIKLRKICFFTISNHIKPFLLFVWLYKRKKKNGILLQIRDNLRKICKKNIICLKNFASLMPVRLCRFLIRKKKEARKLLLRSLRESNPSFNLERVAN